MNPQGGALMPTDNRACMIGSSIESLQSQSSIDYGATDRTREVVPGYAEPFGLQMKKRKTESLKALQLFNAYLPLTENWCHRLLKNLPDTLLYIVSDKPVNPESFPLSNAVFLLKPDIGWPLASGPSSKWGLKHVQSVVDMLWRRLVLHQAGAADVMHAHFSFVGWTWLWLSERKNIPLVVSFYGFDYEYLPNHDPVWHDRYRELFQRAALFLTEGDFGRKKLIEMGCAKEKVRVVPLGVEVSDIPFCRRNKRPGELRLVQVATFTTKKGHDITVGAFIKALQRCPGMTLTLVGKDPEGLRADLQQAVRSHGVEGQVEFVDGIDFSRLHLFLQQFHVFVHPSRYGKLRDSEGGAPVVLLDAQATGMPVLSSAHCDIPSVVLDQKTGILVEENGVEELAQAIEYFYQMKETEYRGFCERARRHVEESYDAVRCSARLKEEYDRLLRIARRGEGGNPP